MACCTLIGAVILAALREKRQPMTYAELLKHISCKLHVPNYFIKSSFGVALDMAHSRGFIYKEGFRYRLRTDFRGIPLRRTVEYVLSKRNEEPNQGNAEPCNSQHAAIDAAEGSVYDPSVLFVENPPISVVTVSSAETLRPSTDSVIYIGTTYITQADRLQMGFGRNPNCPVKQEYCYCGRMF